MFSSGLGAFSGYGNISGFGFVSGRVVFVEAVLASSEAELSGTGDAWTGAAWVTGSLAGDTSAIGSDVTGALTDVSPVNGFLYSLWGVMTSRAVGL